MITSKEKLEDRIREHICQVEETAETLIVNDQGREVLKIEALKQKVNVEEVISRLRAKARLSVMPDELELMSPVQDWNQ